jgi:hypothetical protein
MRIIIEVEGTRASAVATTGSELSEAIAPPWQGPFGDGGGPPAALLAAIEGDAAALEPPVALEDAGGPPSWLFEVIEGSGG